ncbi:MAG: alpha-2-macroglobulin family protein [Candidatus Wallbacteria bacterium]|nr:alpha-2-macroglobulin family protein [Candidatus Wallbacteria bacterium]
MKNLSILCLLAFVLFNFKLLNAGSLWDEVEKAKKDGLPKSAITVLLQIEKQALEKGDRVEALRAITTRIVLESNIEGNHPEEKITRIEAEITKAPQGVKQLLELIQARWFWQYYSRNRWRFLQRSATASLDEVDFTTWDLPKLFNKIDAVYTDVLSQKEYLKTVKTEDFSKFLDKGNMDPALRPTLYDFAAAEALMFYEADDQSIAQPEDAFVLEGTSDAFADLDKFLKFDPQTTDVNSPLLKALKLYQELLAYNQSGNIPGLVDNDIKRLLFIKNKGSGQDLDKTLMERLTVIATEYKDQAPASTALYQIAELLFSEGDYVKAYATAVSGRDLHHDSPGAANCSALISRITAKELDIESEKIVPPGTSSLKIEYRNCDHIYFRVVADDWAQVLEERWAELENYAYDRTEKLLKKKPLLEWECKLEPTPDYKKKMVIKEIPALSEGYYRVIASYNPEFIQSGNIVKFASLWVSKMGLITRPRKELLEGMVTDNLSGTPLKSASVTVYQRDRNGLYKKWKETETSVDGIFSTAPGDRGELLILVKNGKDELVSGPYYCGYLGDKPVYESVLFFTDRSLYRPGQSIYFKGIVFSIDQKNDEYKTIPERQVAVVFRDANYQEIERRTFKSNQFGSFTGTFTAPSGRLTGAMSISADSPPGTAMVRVEEYKRPKFYLEMSPPEKAGKLGEQVTLKGKALAYTGAPIDSAAVKFKVTRQAQMPSWWYWWGFDLPQSGAQEIVHGKLKTGTDGTFSVTFLAKPDPLILEKDNPTFIYTVSADCTDSAGETRSASLSVRLGFAALELTLSATEWLEEDNQFDLNLNAASLDGVSADCEGKLTVYKLLEPEKPVKAQLFKWSYWYRELNEPNKSDYRLWERGESVRESGFSKEKDKAFSTKFALPAGAYTIVATGTDPFGKKIETALPILVFAAGAKKFPVKVPSFDCVRSENLQVGDTLEFVWGTGYDKGQAYLEIEQDGKILQKFWTDASETQRRLTMGIDEKLRGGFTVHATFVQENRAYLVSRQINVPWDNKDLSLKFSTFRSVLKPGQEDEWSVEIKGPGAEAAAAEMVATLYDESLDAFYPHFFQDFKNYFRLHQSSLFPVFTNQQVAFYNFYNEWNTYVSGFTPEYWRFSNELTEDYFGYEMMRGSVKMKGMARKEDSGGRLEEKEIASDSMLAAQAPAPSSAAPGEAQKKEGTASDKGAVNGPESPKPDLSKVSARKNLNETAFFFPQLTTDKDGAVSIKFQMPEALTSWKFMAMAHTTDLKSGQLNGKTVTRKELMVQPNAPRFMREGDILEFTAKVTNMTADTAEGVVKLSLANAESLASMDTDFGNIESEKKFSIPGNQSLGFSWKIKVPNYIGALQYKVVGATDKFSDGEEGILPVLSRRIEVRESIPLWIRDAGSRKFQFKKIAESATSETLVNLDYTVQMASNPSWYAVQALPYLMEFPYECSEQVFNRLYANALAAYIANSDPKIKRIFDQWKGTKTLTSNLEKNQDLKNVLLQETPWVCEAKNETQAKEKIAVLFDDNCTRASLQSAMSKLVNMQLSDGGWPWFPGGRPDAYITMYIVTGFGRLEHLGVKVDTACAVKALDFIDHWLVRTYEEIKRYGHLEENHLSSTIAMYLYGRSFFLKDKEIPGFAKEAFDYFMGQSRKYWLQLDSRMSQGQLALALNRFGEKETPQKIVNSIRERSKSDEELGMYWRETELSWWWYRAPIETQAIMIELFDEVAKDDKSMEDCKVWLLKQKQTQDWKTTKATADAIYALLLRGTNLLASDKIVTVKLGGEPVVPVSVEAGTGFYEKRYSGSEVKSNFGDIEVVKEDKGIAWGGCHWHYLEDMTKVTPHETNLKLHKAVFVERDTKSGKVIEPFKDGDKLEVGDRLKIRIELRTDRDMEYVHLRDMRGSGTEPENVLSQYKYQDGLAYYEATRDTATDFFIDYLPKGTYVFEYSLRVQLKGEYQTGIANIQCMYAPEFSSHSESFMLKVGE